MPTVEASTEDFVGNAFFVRHFSSRKLHTYSIVLIENGQERARARENRNEAAGLPSVSTCACAFVVVGGEI